MKEIPEEPSWFAGWENTLPPPDELMPLSQTLITPDLALAFDINITTLNAAANTTATTNNPSNSNNNNNNQFESSADLGSSEPARTLKRPRLVWTPQLHKRFVDAVAHLGIKNAVPKTIMQLMSVDGLTRENVASHLQKYRLYLKRMQGLSGGAGGSAGGGVRGGSGMISAADDQLFASGPIPHHFIRSGGGVVGGPAHGHVPYVPMAAIHHHHHHHQMAAAVAAAQQQQQQLYHQGFVARPEERSEGGAGRRVLTLFPAGEECE